MRESLIWNPNQKAQDKIILLERMLDFSNRNVWNSGIGWMIEKAAKVRSVFIPIIKNLDVEAIPDEEDDANEDMQNTEDK